MPTTVDSISREELYKLIWTKPKTEISKYLGISDVAVSKACKRMKIPTPERGYWTKISAGKIDKRFPALTPISEEEGWLNIWTIRRKSNANTPLKIKKLDIKKIEVPELLDKPLFIVKESISELKRGNIDNRGILQPKYGSEILDIRVTENSLDRAAAIFDTLIKYLGGEGYKVAYAWGTKHPSTIVEIDGEEIEIGINEKVNQTRHEVTKEEKSLNRNALWRTPTFDYHPSGLLSLHIRNSYSAPQKQWTESKMGDLDSRLSSFIQGLANAAQSEKQRRKENELRKEEWECIEQQRKEIQIAKELENRKIDKLIDEVERWEKANRIERYLKAMTNLREVCASEELRDWLNWAYGYTYELENNHKQTFTRSE